MILTVYCHKPRPDAPPSDWIWLFRRRSRADRWWAVIEAPDHAVIHWSDRMRRDDFLSFYHLYTDCQISAGFAMGLAEDPTTRVLSTILRSPERLADMRTRGIVVREPAIQLA